MADETLQVDEDPEEGKPPTPGRWLIVVGLVLVAGFLFVASPADRQPAIPTTTFPPVPSITVPPTIPPGEVVEQTVVWERPSGLESATTIGGVETLGGDYWIIGTTEAGLAAWRSDDAPGSPWRLEAVFGEGEQWHILDTATMDGTIFVSAAPWPTVGGALFRSEDGLAWSEVDLPSLDASRPITAAREIIPRDDGLLIFGWAAIDSPYEDLLDHLPAGVAEVTRSGNAFVEPRENEIVIHIPPRLEIARVPADALDTPLVSDGSGQVALMWEGGGTDVDPLNASYANLSAWARSTTADGRLVGIVGNRLAFSDDGQEWEPFGPSMTTISGFVPWGEGLVVTRSDGSAEFWLEGVDEPQQDILPATLQQEGAMTHPVGNDGTGLTLLRRGPWSPTVGADTPARSPIETREGETLTLDRTGTTRLLEGEQVVWTVDGSPEVAVMEGGILAFEGENGDFTVEIEEWWASFYGQGQPADSVSIIHSPDGQRWSESGWDDITGLERTGSTLVFGTDDLLVVVDGRLPFRTGVRAVAVGYPVE